MLLLLVVQWSINATGDHSVFVALVAGASAVVFHSLGMADFPDSHVFRGGLFHLWLRLLAAAFLGLLGCCSSARLEHLSHLAGIVEGTV